ncbi:MAG: cytochrome oxidase subunit [Enterovirga sp.]|nr:cytochrome oxidase subunit [Enterovirga sp.]
MLVGCQREQRDLRLDPPVAAALDQVAPTANGIGGAPPDVYVALGGPYESNAYNLGEGKRLYTWFNCKGCHADGGGASGPALMDGWWRYGADPVSLFVSLRDGRPNGMPAYRDKLTTEQIWQLVGYVQTIGMASATTAAPSRNDEMQSRPAENRAPAAADLPTPPSR